MRTQKHKLTPRAASSCGTDSTAKALSSAGPTAVLGKARRGTGHRGKKENGRESTGEKLGGEKSSTYSATCVLSTPGDRHTDMKTAEQLKYAHGIKNCSLPRVFCPHFSPLKAMATLVILRSL